MALPEYTIHDPFASGTTAWHEHAASEQGYRLLKELGHKGISVSHHCYDRAKFSALYDLARARHKQWFDRHVATATPGSDPRAGLKDWVLGTGCAMHDASKALEWATREHLKEGEDILHDLHIVCLSLRNGFEMMADALPEFCLQHVVFGATAFDPAPVEHYWRVLGSDEEWLPVLTQLNPWWYQGQLQVFHEFNGKPTTLSLVQDVVLYVMRIVIFTQTRWTSVGASCRGLLGSLSVGVYELALLALQNKATRMDW